MNNQFLKHLLTLFVGALLCVLLYECSGRTKVKTITVVDRTNEAKIYTQINEANRSRDYWKKEAEKKDTVYNTIVKNRDRIVYRTKFDSTASIDTVLVELIKCDSVKKYNDTAIVNRNEKIEDLTYALIESENAQALQDTLLNKKDTDIENKSKVIRRVKTNNTIKTGIIVILNIASIASPPTAIITTGLSIVVAILPFNKKSKK